MGQLWAHRAYLCVARALRYPCAGVRQVRASSHQLTTELCRAGMEGKGREDGREGGGVRAERCLLGVGVPPPALVLGGHIWDEGTRMWS